MSGQAIEMREVSDAEVAFYRRHGWARLERLIAPELAARMVAQVREPVSTAKAQMIEGHFAGGAISDRADRRDWRFIGRDEGLEPFRSLIYSPQIGRAARRLMDRPVGINYHADLLGVKMPDGHAASKPTGWHQDWPGFPFDRAGSLTFWFALEDMPAERGVMRFLNGSHQEGPLGRLGPLYDRPEVVEHYPSLRDRYEISPAFGMRAGDATVHDGLVIHSAPANSTDQPRWAYLVAYHPADTCYTGAPHHIFNASNGLEVGRPIAGPLFPLVTPASADARDHPA